MAILGDMLGHFGVILAHVGAMLNAPGWLLLGSFGMPNCGHNLPQMAPCGPEGAILDDFEVIVGIMFEIKIEPTSMPDINVFSNVSVVSFWVCFGMHFCVFC